MDIANGPSPRLVAFFIPGEAHDALAAQFRALGARTVEVGALSAARSLLVELRPDVLISEDDLHRPWVGILELVQELDLAMDLVVVSAYASVSSAVRAIKMGAAAYFQAPVSAAQILEALSRPAPASFEPERASVVPSLQRHRWEYLNATLDATRAIKAAAERVGVDRRSLRRMLTTRPPPR